MNSPGSKELGNLLSILQPFHEASNSFSGNTGIFFLPSDAEQICEQGRYQLTVKIWMWKCSGMHVFVSVRFVIINTVY